jgi:DNA-binding PucR family transcriptional regulator
LSARKARAEGARRATGARRTDDGGGAPREKRPSFTLGDLLSNVTVIDVVCSPKGLDVPVRETVIYDPASPPSIDPGALVLGVGVDPAMSAARDLITRAASAGAAAVVLKAGDVTSAREGAEAGGIALLTMPAEMTWSQAHTLIRTAHVSSGVVVADDTAGAPLGDLFALANAFAAMVGGAVTIEDRHSRVLAYSSQADTIDEPRRQTILGRRVPDEWLARLEEEGVFRRLWGGEVVRYEGAKNSGLRPRLALAVRAGDTILGSIWVAEGDRPLGRQAEEALREAARIAALHLIRHRSAEDLDRNLRGDVLRTLLEGQGSVDAIAYRLGIAADSSFAVLAFEPASKDDVEGALDRERVLDLVTLYGEAYRQRSAAVHLGQTIYVLLPGADPAKAQRLLDVARDIVERSKDSLGIALRAGIGSVVQHLREVPRSRREADQVLRALATDDSAASVSDFEAARTRVALVELRDFAAERPHLRSVKLRRLLDHDAEHGTNYAETLRYFLDAFGDIPRAAKAANVHANTLRYRLRRLVEVAGINLDDPDERLLLALDLRISAGGFGGSPPDGRGTKRQ